MARRRFHGLKKVKVRATWNKYNLYNLSRMRDLKTHRTFYQQKWEAKSITRAYHGEHIREKQWQRTFNHRLPGVVAMNHKYLAEHDGSELAAGRGSGRDNPDQKVKFRQRHIPFMHMTYAPMERRLDMAVWRALFASSARQARQFVTHGMVKVNGKKMPYAGYLLNPGDMFQVDVERVLYATGAPKTTDQIKEGRKLHKAYRRSKKASTPRSRIAAAKNAPTTTTGAVARSTVDMVEVRRQRRLDLKELLSQAEAILNDKRRKVGAKRKIAIRAFTKDVRSAMSNLNRKNEKELDDQLAKLVSQLSLVQKGPSPESSSESTNPAAEHDKPSEKEQKALREALTRARENPVDESKPYATPWRPRPYMSAFAFIPRYLEVNHNICAAVYLRHPVARQGRAEVPTPFGEETQQLAFSWYLRRR